MQILNLFYFACLLFVNVSIEKGLASRMIVLLLLLVDIISHCPDRMYILMCVETQTVMAFLFFILILILWVVYK